MSGPAALDVTLPAGVNRPVRSRFYMWMAVVAMAVVVFGFGPSFLHPSGRNAPPSFLSLLHGAVFAAWLLLFLAQATLVANGRVATHRRLGLAAVVLAPAMIVVGYVTTITMARRGYDLSGDLNLVSDPLGLLVFPLGDLLSFGILVGAALWYRKRPAVYKRLMLLATVGALMGAPMAHLFGFVPALRDTGPLISVPLGALYMSNAVYDKVTQGRIHPVSLWGGILMFVYANARAAFIGPSAAWHEFAGWLIR
jgi:hypothetical protein